MEGVSRAMLASLSPVLDTSVRNGSQGAAPALGLYGLSGYSGCSATQVSTQVKAPRSPVPAALPGWLQSCCGLPAGTQRVLHNPQPPGDGGSGASVPARGVAV